MDRPLVELLADEAIKSSLTGTEQNILRMAGNGKSPGAIAQLYGCPAGKVEAMIEEIRERVASATGGTIKQRAEPRPSSQVARPAPNGSPPGGKVPARERVLAYLREHGESSRKEVGEALGISEKSLTNVLRGPVGSGEVRRRPVGRETYLWLGDGKPPEPTPTIPPPPETRALEPQHEDVEAMIDAAAITEPSTRFKEAMRDLLQLLLREGREWTAEKTHAYVEAVRGVYAAYDR